MMELGMWHRYFLKNSRVIFRYNIVIMIIFVIALMSTEILRVITSSFGVLFLEKRSLTNESV